MLILSIETSCDETAMALIEAKNNSIFFLKPQFKVINNIVSSQINLHAPFGGVVPNIAKREHARVLPIIYEELMKGGNHKPDAIAVTVGPGLEPALWTGINFAEDLGKKLNIPVLGANHMEGHLYSFLLSEKKIDADKKSEAQIKVQFPAIALVVSGGHTILLLMKSLKSWRNLGETRDDAVGEAFDKVARLLNLPYPGGPQIEKLAKVGNPKAINFPRPMMNDKNYEFSFSGLKTAVLYHLKNQFPDEVSFKNFRNSSHLVEAVNQKSDISKLIPDIAASFQEAILETLTKKTMRAVKQFKAKSVILCGGVAANSALRNRLKAESNLNGAEFFSPSFEFNTDNAAMIATAAYMRKISHKKPYKPEANSNLTL